MSEVDPVEKFYKKKRLYESKLNNDIKKIINSDLTRDEKKIKIKNLKSKKKCINCKRAVGTTFTNKNKQLSIRCGDSVNPCKLEYIVKLGEAGYIPNLVIFYNKQLEEIKKNIIELKLSLLFGLENEEGISETFDTQKREYKSSLSVLENLEKYVHEDNTIEVDVMGNKEKKLRKEVLIEYSNNLGNKVNEYKSIIADSKNAEGLEKDQLLLDAVEKYKNEIIPFLKEMREKCFNIISINEDEDEKNKFRLYKIKTSFDKKEVIYTNDEVLSDKK